MERDDTIRINWYKALKDADKGSDLSTKINFEFSMQDLLILTDMHEANIYRSKIENLLEDCNFHVENNLLINRKYKVCRNVIIKYYTENTKGENYE